MIYLIVRINNFPETIGDAKPIKAERMSNKMKKKRFDKRFDIRVLVISSIIAVLIAIISVVFTGMKFLDEGGLLLLFLIFIIINIYWITKTGNGLKLRTKKFQHLFVIGILSIAMIISQSKITFQICSIILLTYLMIYIKDWKFLVEKYEHFFAEKSENDKK